jgi:hypothetical protein
MSVSSYGSFMGQSIDQVALESALLTLEEVERVNPPPSQQTISGGEGSAMIVETIESSN